MTTSWTFPKSHRLAGRGAFKLILDARVRENLGPIVVFVKPNGLPDNRLGISIGRPVGNAVVRNRIKRLIRESFRLLQHEAPRGYDVVVIVRPHKPMELADYQTMLSGAMVKLHRRWKGADEGGWMKDEQ